MLLSPELDSAEAEARYFHDLLHGGALERALRLAIAGPKVVDFVPFVTRGRTCDSAHVPTPLEVATSYVARGWKPVPIPFKEKGPKLKDWPTLTTDASNVAQYFNGPEQNIGVQLGPKSNGLTDVDLDCPEAIAAAGYFLPRTGAVFGRASARFSHALFYTGDFADDIGKMELSYKDPAIDPASEARGTLVELRIGGGGKGAQTVFPGSTHATGEAIQWEGSAGELATVDGVALRTAVETIAAVALVGRYWPAKGGRHDAGLVLGGFLARCGMSETAVRLVAEAVAAAANARAGCARTDAKHLIRCASDAAKGYADGVNTWGYPEFVETFGEKVAKKVAEWIAFKGSAATETGAEGEAATLTAARQREARARALAARQQVAQQAGRTLVPRPAVDAPVTPVMRYLDEHLTTDELEPPMRNIDGIPVEARERNPSIDFHELTSEGDNEAGLEGAAKAQLPAPPIPLISEHDATSLTIMVERYLDFYVETATSVRDVAPPAGFLTHYAAYRDSKLPIVRAVATMPLVLPNRRLLSSNGLDRKNGIVFRIPPELMKFIPDPGAITKAEILRAITFLLDDWLGDVTADLANKCVLLAMALSIIERSILEQRPAFFVTAGRRGGGKTTALNLVSVATTGKRAAASAWSAADENERRKNLLATLMEGLPFVVWDNIARGARISSPCIEAALTSATYSDRLLGESRIVTAPTSTIMAFTGNNIAAKGDMCSRSLTAYIDVDRPDPENRTFKHPDPFAWTLEHRGDILKALFMILLGDSARMAAGSGSATRFKTWDQCCGAPIERAAELYRAAAPDKAKNPVSFGDLLKGAEEASDDTLEDVEVLLALEKVWDSSCVFESAKGFKAKDVVRELSGDTFGRLVDVRDWFNDGGKLNVSPKLVGRRLANLVGNPVSDGKDVLKLDSFFDTHTKVTEFRILRKKGV